MADSILIVDDNMLARQLLEQQLIQIGYREIGKALNGTDALGQMIGAHGKGNPFRIVIVDWHMPAMNGFDFLIECRKDPRFAKTAIIIISAECEDGNIRKALDAGATGYLAKPYKLKLLGEKIEQANQWLASLADGAGAGANVKGQHKLADGMAKIIQSSVAETIEMLFATSVQAHANSSKKSAADDILCCSEFMQKGQAAQILFLFDRSLLEKFVRKVFPPGALDDAVAYQSTAAEIVNIVGNGLKRYLNSNGYHFEMTIPHTPVRDKFSPPGGLVVQMAFSCKQEAAMGVDFYMQNH